MDFAPVKGEYIKKMRLEMGMSQVELARLADVSQAHVAKIESGKVDPRLSTVNKILLILSQGEKKKKCCGELMSRVIAVRPDTSVKKVIALMKASGFSQVPVIENGRQLGGISEETLLHNMDKKLDKLQARDIVDKPFPIVDISEATDMLPPLLEAHPAVLVAERGRITGIVTKSDLLGLR